MSVCMYVWHTQGQLYFHHHNTRTANRYLEDTNQVRVNAVVSVSTMF
jgi:hypothetical protein